MKLVIKFKFLAASALVLGGLVLASFTIPQPKQPAPWPVPKEYKTMKNPVPADANSVKVGKSLYNRYCASCHGRTGLGDGPKARMLDTFPGDFSGSAFQSQTDGEIFYRTKEGRGDMPGYDKKVPDEDIWSMVNYMRTFKK